MLKPNQTVYVVSRNGKIKKAKYLKPAFVCRYDDDGRENVAYRVYESKEEALNAISDNGGKLIRSKEAVSGVNLFVDFAKELDLLNLKIEVLSKQKANKPWYCGIFHALGKKED